MLGVPRRRRMTDLQTLYAYHQDVPGMALSSPSTACQRLTPLCRRVCRPRKPSVCLVGWSYRGPGRCGLGREIRPLSDVQSKVPRISTHTSVHIAQSLSPPAPTSQLWPSTPILNTLAHPLLAKSLSTTAPFASYRPPRKVIVSGPLCCQPTSAPSSAACPLGLIVPSDAYYLNSTRDRSFARCPSSALLASASFGPESSIA
ncbi:hypothetical protein BC834DRAFT_313239 [Gloeopeniophorella convolvens]|nr:hypothetical protein BC834DRAFT_313239 [Gloeopeniophorella convolvens]